MKVSRVFRLLFLFAILNAPLPAFGQLGSTKEELIRLYGQPSDTIPSSKPPATEAIAFTPAGREWMLLFYMWRGVAHCVICGKVDGTPVTYAESQKIFDRYKGGSQFVINGVVGKANEYVRADKQMYIIVDKNTITVQTAEFYAAEIGKMLVR